jgi:23S rRNA pseudouridine2605 synthase
MAIDRLQKVLAHRGVASRRAAEEMIKVGRVRVDGMIVTELGVKVDPDVAIIEVDGELVGEKQPPVLIMLNKPRGYVATVKDKHAEKTIMELVKFEGRRLYPVGRLDRDSRGLLLMTDDGELSHKLLHPSHFIEKVYEVRGRGDLSKKDMEKLATGVDLEDGRTAPARLEEVKMDKGRLRFRIVLKEGKKRQIRRMVQALGGHVTDIRRTDFAGLTIGTLPEGHWRLLGPGEIHALRKRVEKAHIEKDKQEKPGGNRRKS